MTPIKLSASALSVFVDCPRCFWMEKVKKIKRPRGIFPSLPSGIDRVLKDYFDIFREKKCLPIELRIKELEGIALYENKTQLDAWRNWRTGMEFTDEDGSILMGALDDLLFKGDLAIPFDYKTKGSPTNAEDATRYYQRQLDCYSLLLESNGLKTADFGFLLYYSPKEVREEGRVHFNVQLIKIPTKSSRALELFRKAVKLLKSTEPPSSELCEYCHWLSKNQESLSST